MTTKCQKQIKIEAAVRWYYAKQAFLKIRKIHKKTPVLDPYFYLSSTLYNSFGTRLDYWTLMTNFVVILIASAKIKNVILPFIFNGQMELIRLEITAAALEMDNPSELQIDLSSILDFLQLLLKLREPIHVTYTYFGSKMTKKLSNCLATSQPKFSKVASNRGLFSLTSSLSNLKLR